MGRRKSVLCCSSAYLFTPVRESLLYSSACRVFLMRDRQGTFGISVGDQPCARGRTRFLNAATSTSNSVSGGDFHGSNAPDPAGTFLRFFNVREGAEHRFVWRLFL